MEYDYKGEYMLIIDRHLNPYKYKYKRPLSEYEVKILNADINSLYNAILDMAIIDSFYVKTVRYMRPNIGKRIKIKEYFRRKDIEAYEWILDNTFYEYSFRWLCSMCGRDYHKIRNILKVPPRFMFDNLPEEYQMIRESTYKIDEGFYKLVMVDYKNGKGNSLRSYLKGF